MEWGKENRIHGQVDAALIKQSLPGTLGTQKDEPRDGPMVSDGNGGFVPMCRHEMEEGFEITDNPDGSIDLKGKDLLANELLEKAGFDSYGNPIKK